MSYVIHLWKHAAPASIEDAVHLHEALLNQAPQPSPECFQLLLQRLVSRFPGPVGGQAGDGPTWVEPSPPVAALEGGVLSLALYGDGPAKLLPYLIDEAGELGMTVMDEQGGCVYLPGRLQLDLHGLSVRPIRKEPGSVKTQESLTERGVKARIKALLQAPLQQHGFAFGKGGDTWCEFVRETPAGLQLIKIYRATEVWQHLFYCSLVPSLRPDVAAAVHPARDIRVFVPLGAEVSGFPTHNYSPVFDCFVAATPDSLDHLLAAFLVAIKNGCIPVLDACSSVSEILAFDAKAQPNGPHLEDSAVLLGLCHLACDDIAVALERQLLKSGRDRGRQRILNEVSQRLAVLVPGPVP